MTSNNFLKINMVFIVIGYLGTLAMLFIFGFTLSAFLYFLIGAVATSIYLVFVLAIHTILRKLEILTPSDIGEISFKKNKVIS